ncbi:multidrug transporter [Natrialba sp. PRR66]|uniref:multidrug transporter n=1 Tax=Natrialba sp. PRR66 TaxID=3098146 RepID=UPI002B1D913A|nr:multidrug transporter [Natrialba sp. PRR66]
MVLALGALVETRSDLITTLGVLVALVAVVGTQVLGWEWGSTELVPTVLGVAAAVVAISYAVYRRSR